MRVLIIPVCLAASVTLGVPTLVSDGFAQTMYRCGSKYQDRPCDSGPSKVVSSRQGGADAPSAKAGAAPDADCTRRGQESMKVVWAREGGATADRMNEDIRGNNSMSPSQKEAQRKLVADVYRQRGSADQVRVRIESECMAEKEEIAKSKILAEALLKSGVKPDFGGGAPAGVGPGQSAVASQGASSNSAQSSNADICRSYANQQDSIQRSQRAGGSASEMESLRRRLEDVRRNMSQARC